MKRSNRLVILVGVLLAVLAFVAIVILLNSTRQTADTADAEQATVLVAVDDIGIGEEVTPARVEAVQVPLDAVQGRPLRDPSQVGGRPALVSIAEGSQVTEESIGLGGTGTECIPCQLNPGEKAIAVQVDPQTGAAFLIQPGDRVDVVVSQEVDVGVPAGDGSAGNEDDAQVEGPRTVKAVIQNKRVLYVSGSVVQSSTPEVDENGDPVQPQTPEAFESIIVVIAGTAQDAEIIKFAQRDSLEFASGRTVSLILRSPDDETVETTTGITLDVLLQQYGVPIPALVDPPGSSPAPAVVDGS